MGWVLRSGEERQGIGSRQSAIGLEQKVFGGCDDCGSAVGGEREKILVASDDEVGVGAFGAFENHVVGGIAAEVDGAAEGDADGIFEDAA